MCIQTYQPGPRPRLFLATSLIKITMKKRVLKLSGRLSLAGFALSSDPSMKASTTLVALVASLRTSDVVGFAFQLPKIQLPWSADPEPATDEPTSALAPGDTVAVVGSSGNVGKLVALRLSDSYKVNGIVRDSSSVEDFFEGREGKIELSNVDLLDEMNASGPSEQLRGALESANALVICTGTTAFPTKVSQARSPPLPRVDSTFLLQQSLTTGLEQIGRGGHSRRCDLGAA